MEIVAPVASLFFEERLKLADSGLAQVDDIHGQRKFGATPAAR
jgi:hypothetical protein